MFTYSWLKNHEGVFPYLEANNLACHRFMALAQGIRQVGYKQKDLLVFTYGTVSEMSFMLLSVIVLSTHHQVPWG